MGKDAPLAELRGALGAVDRPIHWTTRPEMDLAQVTQPPAGGGPPNARVWVDCTDPSRVRLYFANWSTERFLLRDVPSEDGYSPLTLETVAQMIEGSLSTLLVDRTAGLSRSQMGSAIGEKARATPGPRPGAIDASIGAFYAAQAFAQGWPVEHGPGIAADLAMAQGPVRPGAWLTAQLQLPETVDTSLAGVQVVTVALRAGGEVTTSLAAQSTLTWRIGVGGDVIHAVPRAGTVANATLSDTRSYWDTMVQFVALFRAPLAPHFVFSVAALVDADLVLRHYDVELDGATLRILTPWRVRPGLMIGFAWH